MCKAYTAWCVFVQAGFSPDTEVDAHHTILCGVAVGEKPEKRGMGLEIRGQYVARGST